MAIPKDVKAVLIKVFQVFKEDPSKLTDLHPAYYGKDDERAYTVENLENVACNHLFDDNHDAYRITELEGCIIRHYFSMGAGTHDNFVKDLREEFPDFFKHPESEEYLDYVNYRRRMELGLSSNSL